MYVVSVCGADLDLAPSGSGISGVRVAVALSILSTDLGSVVSLGGLSTPDSDVTVF